jgi:hypothetical protein
MSEALSKFGPRLKIALLVSILLKLWLVAAQPVVAAGWAGHDDRLFLELANHILRGEWLGDYSQFTLMKGPMYSLWIVGTFMVGVPLPLAQHLLYLCGCCLVVRALQPRFARRWMGFALFTFLWWQPMSYESRVLGRVLRQNFYTPATLLVFAGLIALTTRRNSTIVVRMAWGALLGLSVGALWLTREESVWIIPAIGLLVAISAWRSWRAGERLRPLLAPVLAASLCFAGVLGTISTLNYRHYGWFGTVEFRAPQFLAAYGALQRPIASHDVPYVPVSREMRLKLYDVSPSFAELKPFLEGGLGEGWAKACENLTGRPANEREIAGGWFMWALRDAVVAAGHGQSAREALTFYGRIAEEVNRACDAGSVGPVHRRRDTMMPPWRAEHTQRLRDSIVEYMEYFFLFRGFSVEGPSSNGTSDTLRLFRDLTRSPLTPSLEAPELDLPLQLQFDRMRLTVLRLIGKTFRWLCASVAITGLFPWIGMVVQLARKSRADSYLFWVTTTFLGTALSVVLINLLVHVLSFYNQSTGAFAQAYPLIVAFGTLAWIGFLNSSTVRQAIYHSPSPDRKPALSAVG